MSHLVSVTEIQMAADRLRGVAVHTPLVPFAGVDPPLLIKAESLQPTGAFKLRGAYNAISALPPEQRSRGVVAHSSGNHAHAVAYAAALLGVSATVVVPSNAPEVKVEAARSQGAEIVICEPGLANRMTVVAGWLPNLITQRYRHLNTEKSSQVRERLVSRLLPIAPTSI